MVSCTGNARTGCLVPELIPPELESFYPHLLWKMARGQRLGEAMTALEFRLDRIAGGTLSDMGEAVMKTQLSTLRWWLTAASTKVTLSDEDILCGWSIVVGMVLQIAIPKGITILTKVKDVAERQLLRRAFDVDVVIRLLSKKTPTKPHSAAATQPPSTTPPSNNNTFRSSGDQQRHFSGTRGGRKVETKEITRGVEEETGPGDRDVHTAATGALTDKLSESLKGKKGRGNTNKTHQSGGQRTCTRTDIKEAIKMIVGQDPRKLKRSARAKGHITRSAEWRMRVSQGEAWLTSKWRQTILRFAPFAPLEAAEIGQALELGRSRFRWKYSTVATYCSAIISGKKFLTNRATPKALTSLGAFYEKRARTEKKTKAPPMTERHARRLERAMRRQRSPMEIGILLAWMFGQRISDVLQLHADDIETFRTRRAFASNHSPHGHTNTSPPAKRSFIVVTFRRGKTIGTTGPFTLHIDSDLSVARWVRELAHRHRGRFLFTGDPENSKRTRARMSASTRNAMKMMGERLEARSIRRGGLQAMAGIGMTMETIQTFFSQHRSTRMLREYLDHGKFDGTQAIHHTTRTAQFPWASSTPQGGASASNRHK
jgi:hypothetical protein